MKNKFINVYGTIALLVLAAALVWFALSITAETRKGVVEAERSFNWISRESSAAAVADGFMSNSFINKLTGMCNQSKLLAALVITTPSGTAFAWPNQSTTITYDINGNPSISNTSLFMKVYAEKMDIGDVQDGSVVMTAAVYVLHPDAIFAASRNSFLAILTILFATLIVIFAFSPVKAAGKASKTVKSDRTSLPKAKTSDETGDSISSVEYESDDNFIPPDTTSMLDESFIDEATEIEEDDSLLPLDEPFPLVIETGDETSGNQTADYDALQEKKTVTQPEGLFSPVTGIGWEQYLSERLDSELVRAASSEQDISLIIIRISGLLHTDLLSRKIAKVLLETFKFKDMVFEFGSNGFAGILQNINLDQAMKVADTLYAGIDSLLMEMSHEGQITVGITTRTARLLPASRMIEEALSAARKAEEEPSLPIVAFRANPEKYRDFVAENN